MTTTSDLANALATVAIAALGGPVPASTAALKELVKFGLARREERAPARELQRQVGETIGQWAGGERIAGHDVELGLDEAARAIAGHGVSSRDSARLEYDARQAARTVVGRAKAADRRWGSEDHYEVAERAIEVTYGALFGRIRKDNSVLLPAIEAARSDISGQIAAIGQHLDQRFDGMQTAVVGGFTDVEAHLVELKEQVGRLQPSQDEAKQHLGGTLRLSWDRGQTREPILATDDFDVSIGRNASSRVLLTDARDSRFHGHLSLQGLSLQYQHLGSGTAYLISATRQLALAKGDSCPVADKDRLQFASGTILIEFSAPDLFDPGALPTPLLEPEEG